MLKILRPRKKCQHKYPFGNAVWVALVNGYPVPIMVYCKKCGLAHLLTYDASDPHWYIKLWHWITRSHSYRLTDTGGYQPNERVIKGICNCGKEVSFKISELEAVNLDFGKMKKLVHNYIEKEKIENVKNAGN
jgi:hypothetical protein